MGTWLVKRITALVELYVGRICCCLEYFFWRDEVETQKKVPKEQIYVGFRSRLPAHEAIALVCHSTDNTGPFPENAMFNI